MSIDVKRLKALKSRMNEDQKQKLLIGLRRMREDLGENPVDGNMLTAENEFTTTDSQPHQKVIAKTFDTNSDFDSYVNQRRGIEMTPKELQALTAMTEQADPNEPTPSSSSEPSQDEETVDDKIRIQKSLTFVDETQGAEILTKFLAELGLDKQRPNGGDKFSLRYEMTDEFGKNTTTVIKKLKEGPQFCWTAFSKYESAEEEGRPDEET
jgi:hypothetical protein